MTSERFDQLRADYFSQPMVECLDEIARLAALVYVPGSFHCPKCKFSLVKSIVYMGNGAIGADHNCSEKCPNDGALLEPTTWEFDARQMSELMPELARLRRLNDAARQINGIDTIRLRKVANWFDTVQNNPGKREALGWNVDDREVQETLRNLASKLDNLRLIGIMGH